MCNVTSPPSHSQLTITHPHYHTITTHTLQTHHSHLTNPSLTPSYVHTHIITQSPHTPTPSKLTTRILTNLPFTTSQTHHSHPHKPTTHTLTHSQTHHSHILNFSCHEPFLSIFVFSCGGWRRRAEERRGI